MPLPHLCFICVYPWPLSFVAAFEGELRDA